MSAPLPFTDSDRALLTALRRDLHANPELSWKETATQARLERALRDVGVTNVQRVVGTGLVARIPGRSIGAPAVAVRGDIDALPITEATGLPYASKSDGVMHACGHDVHASWAVGAALLLARSPADGEVRIVLQPAEELGEGAKAILESGALDGVRAIFGGHVDRRFAVGEVVAAHNALDRAEEVKTRRAVADQVKGAEYVAPALARVEVQAAKRVNHDRLREQSIGLRPAGHGLKRNREADDRCHGVRKHRQHIPPALFGQNPITSVCRGIGEDL